MMGAEGEKKDDKPTIEQEKQSVGVMRKSKKSEAQMYSHEQTLPTTFVMGVSPSLPSHVTYTIATAHRLPLPMADGHKTIYLCWVHYSTQSCKARSRAPATQ
ncbi:hypothetical protein Pmani_037096 [Petrolisthes manimaculis]|uniref:Uncharacterized protein n=1 Tax=Petrolisthes manimaculis TaxID=1843537 RepID=A0AAE1NIW0_9EUCA|nr:hypothetical protein Pmani_037096 [Petrolisthes manimaculis]